MSTTSATTTAACTRAPNDNEPRWSSEAPMSSNVATTRGLAKAGSHGRMYSAKAKARAPRGTAKPTMSESQPATKAAPGCRVRDRKTYSPPDSGIRCARAP